MKTKLLYFSILFVALVSCAKEEGKVVVDNGQNSYTIPLSEALASLDKVMNGLKMVSGTKSFTSDGNYSVESFGLNNVPSTKADNLDYELPDTLMYLVNFDSAEGGFAVLAGDSRLGESVYCVTENGEIGVENFAEAFDFLHSSNTKAVEIDEDSFYDMGTGFVPALLLSSMLADLKYGPVVEEETTKATAVSTNSVLLETKWRQGAPFNTYTLDSSGNTCPAGCVAIACAQIMEYCQKPANPTFDGVSCSWADMATVYSYQHIDANHCTDSAKEQVARFLKHIGKKSLCYIRYAVDGSYGYADGVVRTLNNYNYSSVTKRSGFGSANQSRASSMLGNSRPVYLDGSDHHNGGGHAWVVDGEWNGYFHCNWGWAGKWDGFYAKHNYFPINSRAYYEQDVDPGTTDSSVSSKDYDWNFRMITYSY